MLKPAILYKNQLEQLFPTLLFNKKYNFIDNNGYQNFNYKIEDSTWNNIQAVSLQEENIIGYLSANLNRVCNYIENLFILNFLDDPIIFGKDLKNFIEKLFFHFNFNKIKFSVLCGNPAEKFYDRLVEKYNGRIVGFFKNDAKTIDGKIVNVKYYEIMRENAFLKIPAIHVYKDIFTLECKQLNTI